MAQLGMGSKAKILQVFCKASFSVKTADFALFQDFYLFEKHCGFQKISKTI